MICKKDKAQYLVRKYHIVWNATKTEGYITSDSVDAAFASHGRNDHNDTSTLAEAFREIYAHAEGTVLDVQNTILAVQVGGGQ